MDKEDKIHCLNVFLMVISLVVAMIVPFELFLIAYAVLGPLHYLTEINWLNKQSYFIPTKNRIWILFTVATIISVLMLLAFFARSHMVGKFANDFYGTFVLTSLVLAGGLVYSKNLKALFLLFIITASSLFLLNGLPMYQLWAALLLPSLVHVYLFTLCFISYGVLKRPNRFGNLEIVSLILIPLIIFVFPLEQSWYSLQGKTLSVFVESNFQNLALRVGDVLKPGASEEGLAFVTSELGLRIQIFTAFAYTYHYFNWFSKVSLIGWMRKSTIGESVFIFCVWAAAVALYYFDYRIGLTTLFLLSLLHVILEFPLNVISIQTIGVFLRRKITP